MPTLGAVLTDTIGITSHSQPAWYCAYAWCGTNYQYWNNFSFTIDVVLCRRSVMYRLSVLEYRCDTVSTLGAVPTDNTCKTSYLKPAWYQADALNGTNCRYWHNFSFTNTMVLVTIIRITQFIAFLTTCTGISSYLWYSECVCTVCTVLTASTGITSYFKPAWYCANSRCGITFQYWHNFLFVTGVVPCRCSVQYLLPVLE